MQIKIDSEDSDGMQFFYVPTCIAAGTPCTRQMEHLAKHVLHTATGCSSGTEAEAHKAALSLLVSAAPKKGSVACQAECAKEGLRVRFVGVQLARTIAVVPRVDEVECSQATCAVPTSGTIGGRGWQ